MRSTRRAASLVAALLLGVAAATPARGDEPRRIEITVNVGATDEARGTLAKARALLSAGKPSEAEPLAERAVKLLERDAGSHPRELAEALLFRGAVRDDLAQHDQADSDLRRATNLYEGVYGPESSMVAVTIRNHGIVRSNRGDHKQAIELLRRALAIAEKSLPRGSSDMLADFLEPLAGELLAIDDISGAAGLIARALAIRDTPANKEPVQLAIILESAAILQSRLGDDKKALALYERALDLRERAQGPDHVSVAMTLHSIAVLRGESGAIEEAMKLEERALGLFERAYGPLHPSLVEPLENIALLHLKRLDVDASCGALERANDIVEVNLRHVLGGGSERETLAYLATIKPRVDQRVYRAASLVSRHARSVRAALTSVFRYKGRALDVQSNTLETLRRRLPPEKRMSIDELRGAQAALAKLTLGSLGGAKPDLAEQRRLTEIIESRQSWVASQSAYFHENAAPITFDAMQAAIPSGAALVEFYAYDEPHARNAAAIPHYAAFVMRSSGDPFAVELGEAAAIDQAIQKTRAALADQSRNDYKELATSLDALLFRPLSKAIGDASMVFIAPDRAINLVPFEALYDEGGHARIDRYAFTYLTSGRDLRSFAARSPLRTAPFVVANPDFDAAPSRVAAPEAGSSSEAASRGVELLGHARFPALKGTEEEGARVAEELPGAALFTGALATKDILFRLRGPSVVHIATHGFFLPKSESEAQVDADGNPNPAFDNPLLRSGLVFSGANQKAGKFQGILTALEAAGLDLEGTRLVTLSACETGLGDVAGGDGVYGLRRALIIAGAETMVMSLWKVSDQATRDLMIAYYDHLRAGEGASDALRQVRLALKATPGHEHPHYWASFIVSGNPSPILPGTTRPAALGAAPPASRGCACELPVNREPSDSWRICIVIGSLVLALRRRRRYGDPV